MNLIILLNIFCITITTCMAAASIGIFKDPNHPDKCVVGGYVVSPGKTVYPEGCQKIVCHQNSQAELYSCGLYVAPAGFKLGKPINATADYPECCQSEIIPE